MSSRRLLSNGFTLMEMVVTIVLFGVIAAVGSQLIGKLVPSYLLSAQAQQSLSPREAALWRLSEDFRRALLDDGTRMTGCRLDLVVASGVSGVYGETMVSHAVAYWWDGENLRMSNAAVSGIVLNGVQGKLAGNCPFIYTSTGCKGRMCLNLVFNYPDPDKADVHIPVSTTLYSYVNGPYVASAVLGGGAVSTVSLSGFFPGMPGILSSVTFTSNATPTPAQISATVTTADRVQIIANITPVASAVIDVKVATPEGWSVLKKAFTFP